jgi:hypothetical protein
VGIIVVALYGLATYMLLGEVSAVFRTVVFGAALFAILEVAGKGSWRESPKWFREYPATTLVVLVLLLSILVSRFEGITAAFLLDAVLFACFLWGAFVFFEWLNRRLLEKFRAMRKRSG